MKRTILPFTIIAVILLITGCGETPPVAIKWNEPAKPELDKKIVTLEGYAQLPYSVSTGAIQLQPRKESGAEGVKVAPAIGSGNNQMLSLPNNFQNSDLKFKTDKGEACGYNDYIRVTGECSYSAYNNSYFIKNVTKIEKIAAPSEDYATMGAVELTPDKMKDLNNMLVIAEGNIIVPEQFMDENGIATLQFANDKITTPLSLIIPYTDEPSATASQLLPEEATKEDVVVYDKNKQPVDLSKKVRIYGTWRQDKNSSQAPYLRVEEITVL